MIKVRVIISLSPSIYRDKSPLRLQSTKKAAVVSHEAMPQKGRLVMRRLINTTFAPSMVRDGRTEFKTFTTEQAIAWLIEGQFENVANPTHMNTLQVATSRLGVDLTQAKGGRVLLQEGDQCLVIQVTGLPRETREYTDAEIAAAKFDFRLVTFLG